MVPFITVLHILHPHDNTETQLSLGKTAALTAGQHTERKHTTARRAEAAMFT